MANLVNLFSSLPDELKGAIDLAQTCKWDENHSRQVTWIALLLYDGLQTLHRLGGQERFYLMCAGILHEVGCINGWKGHHKESLRIILNTTLLNYSTKQRLIIGSIARYHRKALPSLKHSHYAALDIADRKVTNQLAACLRLADGMDCTHQQRLQDLNCKISDKKIIISCTTSTLALEEAQIAKEKSDLMKLTFHKKVVIHWSPML